jgi:predicted RNA binding protein YcfA (HicA-like mRNA interferase family)
VGRLRVLSGKAACAILEANGFTKVRQRGSHVIMQKCIGNSTTTVPAPHSNACYVDLFVHEHISLPGTRRERLERILT